MLFAIQSPQFFLPPLRLPPRRPKSATSLVAISVVSLDLSRRVLTLDCALRAEIHTLALVRLVLVLQVGPVPLLQPDFSLHHADLAHVLLGRCSELVGLSHYLRLLLYSPGPHLARGR